MYEKSASFKDKAKQTKDSDQQDERSAKPDPRNEMRSMGNKLVELTDSLISRSKGFFTKFNKTMMYVKLEQFIFQEADYMEVALKECGEIA